MTIHLLTLREFLASKQITVLEHPSYLPDLDPNYFLLFPKIKGILKGRHFDDTDDNGSSEGHSTKPVPTFFFKGGLGVGISA
jgi:hypothetical protein